MVPLALPPRDRDCDLLLGAAKERIFASQPAPLPNGKLRLEALPRSRSFRPLSACRTPLGSPRCGRRRYCARPPETPCAASRPALQTSEQI